MTDERMPRQEGENELEAPADALLTETAEDAPAPDTDPAAEELAEAAAETASDVSDAEDAMQKALDAMDELPETDELYAEDAFPEEAEAETAAVSKGDAIKDKAANLADKLKQSAGKLSDDIKKSAKKKKKQNAAKKKKNERTFEEEMADLAEEEKQFDEWGRRIRRKRKFRRKKSRGLSCTLVLLTLILALSSVLAAAIIAVAMEMYGINKDVGEKIVTIPDGSATADIANQLVDERIITLPQVFRLVSRMNGKDGSYIAGEHYLSPSMSYEAMIDELCKNHKDERESMRVVFPEGIKLVDAAKSLQENQICDAEEFLFYFNSFNGEGYDFRFTSHLPEKNPQKWQQREGYCFPDTYEFYIDEDPNIVAQKIYANFDSKITDLDYQKMEELGMSLDELLTLASMVQGEASRVDYMKHISAIFHNRLNSPAVFPKLESDPTRKYAELIEKSLEIPDEIMTTAYNTYKGTGLPPGAINNPGKEAIEAVLYPLSPCNDFFFNSNIDTGETFFAETYDQHLANLDLVNAQYAAAQAAANGEG